MRFVITACAQEEVSVAPTSAIERGTSSEPEPATDDSIGVGIDREATELEAAATLVETQNEPKALGSR